MSKCWAALGEGKHRETGVFRDALCRSTESYLAFQSEALAHLDFSRRHGKKLRCVDGWHENDVIMSGLGQT